MVPSLDFYKIFPTSIFLLVATALISTSQLSPTPKDVRSFINVINKSGISQLATYGGVAWSDYDNDGFPDLLMPVQNNGYHLYHNNQDGTFIDATIQVHLNLNPYSINATFGDYDNDGCPDLYVANHGPVGSLSDLGISDTLYHNNCDGTFSDVTTPAGISDRSHGSGIAWLDYDRDGRLDIYVNNWGVLIASGGTKVDFKSEPNLLYHNNGGGTFTEVALRTGVTGLAHCANYQTDQELPQHEQDVHISEGNVIDGLKANWTATSFDYDNDGWPDIFVTNEWGTATLYHNNGDGSFGDLTQKAGLCLRHSWHGAAIGDYDNDGFQDIYVTGSKRNLLWHNNGNGTFSEISEKSGVANFGFLGWGGGFIDYNNDSLIDIYSANGATSHPSNSYYKSDIDHLYINKGQGVFEEVAEKVGIVGDDPKRSTAFADFNRDGFVDIFTESQQDLPGSGPNRLYLNRPNGNHWLTLKLVGTKSNRDGVGARIELTNGTLTQTKQVTAGGSTYLSQNSLWPTFGLGALTHISQIKIFWTSGITQTVKNVPIDRMLTITEPTR